jgi:hypothetical protein
MITGGAPSTVRPKFSLACAPDEAFRTSIVMTALPISLVVGLSEMVRFVPLPPSRMFASGTKVGLEDLAIRTRSDGPVSTSAMVNGMGASQY